MLVNGVCPNCSPESLTSAAADAAPASEPLSMPAPGFTPFCETPDGNVLQQAAAGFGFLKEKGEKIQCVYGEEYFNHYMSKRRVNRKGFVVVTDKYAYFGGKMVFTTPGAPLVKEKGVRTLPLKDISAVGLGGKYMDKRKVTSRRIKKHIAVMGSVFVAIFFLALGFFLSLSVGGGGGGFLIALIIGLPLVALSVFIIVDTINYYKYGGGYAKVLFNIQHSGGTLQLAARMSKVSMDPINGFVQHFNQCIANVKAAEEARIAEEKRLAKEAAEEARLAEEKRLAGEAAEKARLEKEAAAMQQAMEKAMQSAPASAASSIAEELKAYSEMYKQGLINDEEFAAFKAKLLGK